MFNGTVQRTFSKPFGGKLLHSFTLQGEKGFFGMGRDAPTFKEGDSISFEANPSKREGNFDVNVRSIVVAKEAPVKVEDYSMSGARKQTVLQKDDYWNRKEERDIQVQKVIQIQAARNAAIAVLQAMQPDLTDESPEDFIGRWTDLFLADNEERVA